MLHGHQQSLHFYSSIAPSLDQQSLTPCHPLQEVLLLEHLILICIKLLGSNPSICLDTSYQHPNAIELHLRPENQNTQQMSLASYCSWYPCTKCQCSLELVQMRQSNITCLMARHTAGQEYIFCRLRQGGNAISECTALTFRPMHACLMIF